MRTSSPCRRLSRRNAGGRRRPDRRAASLLEHGGRLQDCARLAGAPWAATTGHWPGDPHPPRRIDRWYGSWHLPDTAVTGYRVHDLPGLSDHLPIEVTIDPSALS